MSEDSIYVNAYKGGDNPKGPKVKGKLYPKDVQKLAELFPQGCDFAIFKNVDGGQKKSIKGKEITIADFSIKFSPPFKAGAKKGNSRNTEESDF